MGILVGGDDAWRVRRHGDLVVAYHWVNDEPAMVIYPAISNGSRSSAIIALSAAHKYAEPRTGEPTVHLLQQAAAITKHLGMVVTRDAVRRVADVIVEGIPDLIDMPPEPTQFAIDRHRAQGRTGEVTIKAGGETVLTAEV